MRYYPNKNGPFPLGIYFEDSEIESAAFEQLQKANLLPSHDQPCVNVDALLKVNYGLDPIFEDLDADLLGKSEFYRDGTIRVIISLGLGEECNGVKENLYRTTLAHEIGHVVLHRILFMEDTLKLQGITELSQSMYPVLCRSNSSLNGIREYSGEWWEWQANRFMSSLLMPKYHVVKLCGAIRASNKECSTAQLKGIAASRISSLMKVSMQASTIRLAQLNLFQADEGQIELAI